jgi:hypothetical protein
MAYPDNPVIAYSYTGFQQAQGDNRFPGTQLDADLAALVRSIVEINSTVQGVTRDDGALKNGVVTFESFSALVTANYRSVIAAGGGLQHSIVKFENLSEALQAAYGDTEALEHLAELVATSTANAEATAADVLVTHADVVLTNADVVLTHADVVLTHADAAATAADRVQTGLDLLATHADVVLTHADAAATAADRVQTGLDRIATGADVVLTHADAAATAADRVQTGLDRVATGANVVSTHADAVATAADRVQTGIDAAAAAASAASIIIDTDGTLAANSDTRLASQKATKTYVDALLAANDAMVFKGVIDCSANPNYPAADRGHTYRVSVAGKIGGASGVNVEAGDILLCITDGTAAGNQATVGSAWGVIQVNIDGAVTLTGTQTLLNKTLTSPVINSPTGLMKGDVGLSNVDNTSDATKNAAAVTLTNKRNQPRLSSSASGDISPDVSAADIYVRTALAAAAAINSPSGTPVQGEKLIFRVKDDGTSRTLTWNAIYRAIGVTIPTATTISKTTYVGAIYNATDTKWDVIAATTEA